MRIRLQYEDLYGESMDEEALEDNTGEDPKDEDDVISISSDDESHEDKEGPLMEFDDDIGPKEPWIWRPKY